MMKSGQQIPGDQTQDPRLSCPNFDHCTTASLGKIKVNKTSGPD